MSTTAEAAAKIVALLAALVMVFGGAWAVGAQVDPIGAGPAPVDGGHGAGHDDAHDEPGNERSERSATGESAPPGLSVADRGHRLVLAEQVVEPGDREIAFTIEGPDGRPVTDFDVAHERRLHLIVVRRDHTGFQHVHPDLDETTGRWTSRVELTPGQWRVFADFTAAGAAPLVLGSDLLVPGNQPRPGSTGQVRTDAVDSYSVTVDGHLRPGEHSSLVLRVREDGRPVTDLQPYLGAFGHLVALREGDLAYLHVHPGGEPGDGRTQPGPDVEFVAEVPSAGRYHLYLDFRHGGVVRTAHLVLDAGADTGTDTGTGTGTGTGTHEEHP